MQNTEPKSAHGTKTRNQPRKRENEKNPYVKANFTFKPIRKLRKSTGAMLIMNCLNLGCKPASFLSRLAMGLLFADGFESEGSQLYDR